MNTSFVKLGRFNEINTILKETSERIEKELGMRVWLHVYPYALNNLSPDSIITVVANTLEIPESEIRDHNRNREVVEARYIAMKIIRDNFKLSLSSIGSIFRNDHSTVIYALGQVSNLMDSDKHFQDKFKKVCKQLMLIAD
jgi:chromosomal replication initiation ATPase DnaA